MINCEVSRTGDWATSFEKCTDVSVVNYRHRKSGGTLYGGRDGIHFLDCVNFTLNGADIESGDDMVGCTTETRDQRNAVIRNVIGYSMLASGVIFNEEGATVFDPIFPDTCYHLTHYWYAAADIPVASDNPAHYADAIRYNAR
ncbi:hypothetical protein JTY90_30425, partial [Klebsiella michiganensis]|uniref:hypothetical protein n=1 Tax=Klebsiella michiganensis TaxID=1134687 RepID=UPI00195D0BE5